MLLYSTVADTYERNKRRCTQLWQTVREKHKCHRTQLWLTLMEKINVTVLCPSWHIQRLIKCEYIRFQYQYILYPLGSLHWLTRYDYVIYWRVTYKLRWFTYHFTLNTSLISRVMIKKQGWPSTNIHSNYQFSITINVTILSMFK